MLALLFILIITGLCILISYIFSPEITWLTYYLGAVAGLLVSAVIIQIWTRIKKKKEEEEKKKIK